MHLFDDTVTAWMPSASTSTGMAPNDATASTRNPRPRSRQSAATSSNGLISPVLVSQWTMKTWLIAGSASSLAAKSAAVGGVKGSVRSIATGVPSAWQISPRRSP